MKRVITEQTIEAEHAAGRHTVVAPSSEAVVTPGAWSRARELGIAIAPSEAEASALLSRRAKSGPPPRRPVTDAGSVERLEDASGAVVVKGASVRLGRFNGAGPGKHVGLLDVVTAKDGSPMAAGFMSWTHDDAFAWSLDYDEVDYVVAGELHVEIDGRTLRAVVGDVVYLPKGSRIVFGTPSQVTLFYVTYPANWSG